jgi:hypothetical protein
LFLREPLGKRPCKKCAHGVWTCASSTSNCSQAKIITNALFEDIANRRDDKLSCQNLGPDSALPEGYTQAQRLKNQEA